MRSNENFLKSLQGRTKRREREKVGGVCKINFQPQWKLDYCHSLLNACLEKDKVDFEVLASGFKDNVESKVVGRLTHLMEYLCQSLKLCLNNLSGNKTS